MAVLDYLSGLFEVERVIKKIRLNGQAVSVVKTKSYVELRYDDIAYSRCISDSIYTNGYWDYFTPLPSFYKNPRVLLIGLGGGTIPLQLCSIYRGLKIDVVENSTKIAMLADTFVGLCREMSPQTYTDYAVDVKIHDGAAYLKNSDKQYHIIILDAYIGSQIPGAFITEQFVGDACHALTKDGILAINYSYNPHSADNFDELIKLLKHRFNVYSVNAPPLPGNIIIICSKSMDQKQIAHKVNSHIEALSSRAPYMLRRYYTMSTY